MKIDRNLCDVCGGCVAVCPADALICSEWQTTCDLSKCTRCGLCLKVCPVGAISHD